MALPAGVTTRTVTLGPGVTVEAGDALGVQVAVKASRDLVWSATGTAVRSVEKIYENEAGLELEFELPVTDQEGWLLNGAVVDVTGGKQSHYYNLTVKFYAAGSAQPVSSSVIGPISIPTGDGTPIDADKLIPATTAGGATISIPDAWSEAVAQAQAAAVAAEAALVDSDVFVETKVAGDLGDPETVIGSAALTSYARSREFDPRNYGAAWDNVTDDYDAMAATIAAATAWIVLGGRAKIVCPPGCAYLGKAGAGGLRILPSAVGLVIEGMGKEVTGLRLSKEVLRAFDLLTYNASYSGIQIRGLYIDADNIDDTDIGPATTCSAVTLTGNGATTSVPVASTVGWATRGRCLLPSTNGGTSAGSTFPFVVLDGTHIQITNYGSSATISSGDTIQGAINDHLIIGTQSGVSVTLDTNISGVLVEDVWVVNVPTKPGASFDADRPHVRWGACIAPRTSTTPSTPIVVEHITFRRVKIFGGEAGLYVGSFGTAPQNIQLYLDDINYEDCYHSTQILPTTNYFSLNFEIGGSASGNRSSIRRCTGWGSGDVGVEVNGMLDHVTEDCLIEEFQGGGYYQVNYGIPSDSPTGPPKMVLSADVNSAVTTANITALPAEGIPLVGYAVIDTEVVQYTIASDTSLTLVRGFNGSAAASHASGTTVRTIPVHRQRIKNVRNRARLRQITPASSTAMPPGFYATAQSAKYPHGAMILRDCEVENSLSMMGSRAANGDAVHTSGWIPGIDIDGLHVERHGISYTTLDSRAGALITCRSTDTGATGPQTSVKIDRFEAVVSGKLATGGSAPVYDTIAPDTGRWRLDLGSIDLDIRLRNVQAQSTRAISFVPTGAAMRLHGSCKRLRLATATSGDGAPRAFFANGTLTLDSFHIDDLDLTDMWFGQSTGNPNYQPVTAGTYAPAVTVRTWRHPTTIQATSIYAGRNSRRRTVYTAGATLAATDEYVASQLTAPGTFTLRTANATGSVAAPNPAVGREVWIKDEAGNAATHNITITPATSETIDGSTSSKVINTNGGMVKLMAVGSGWVTV